MSQLEDLPVSSILGFSDIDKAKPISSKVFATPFRLVFETADGKTTLIKVETLTGLKEVMRRLNEGEIVARHGYSLEIQLWGHLASYCGFLRAKADDDGLQPLGEEFTALTDDLSVITGGEDNALAMLNEMKSITRRPQDTKRAYVRPDDVNLTPEGEKKLAEIVDEPLDPLHTQMDAAVILYSQTEPPQTDTDAEIRAQQLAEGITEPRTISGPEAEEIGRRVEEVGTGEALENKTEEDNKPEQES